MITFLAKRIGAGLILVVVVPTLTFLLAFAGTANVSRTMLGNDASAEAVAAKNHELGLDQPLLTQYFHWAGKVVQGDFGSSWFTQQKITDAVASRLPVTLSMVLLAVAITAIVSTLLGMSAAVRGGVLDRIIQVLSIVGFSLPNFWVALMMVLAFAIAIPIFPATGYVPFEQDPGLWIMSLVLPVFSLILGGIANSSQQVRGAVIDVLRQDFIRTLRSRGLSTRSVLLRHALRNAASPALMVLSLQFIGLLGGAVVVEKVFAIPGLGTLTVDAATQGDLPVLMGVVVNLVIMVVIVNLIIDVLSGWVNPKVRVQ